MSESRHSIDNLVHLLSPNYQLPLDIRLRDNFIFEAPLTGFFKFAYSPKQRAMVLYYARHPGDFTLGTAESGGLKDNPHIHPVCFKPISYSEAARWSPGELQQHNVGWAYEEIMRVIRILPEVLLKEATLHRLGKDCYGSGYVGYCALPEGRGAFSKIEIATNMREGWELIEVKPPMDLTGEKSIAHAFRWFGRQLLRHLPSPNFPLGVAYRTEGRSDVRVHKQFVEAAIIPVIKADFMSRMTSIWSGVDPIKWRENYFMPVVRIHEKIRHRMEEMRAMFIEDKRRTVVQGFIAIGRMVTTGALEFIGDFIVDTLAEASLHEGPSRVPKKWQGALKDDQHLLSIARYLNHILLKINPKNFFSPKYFADIQWLMPDMHSLSAAPRSNFNNDARDDGFATWFRGHFFTPYAGMMEYIGEGGNILGLEDTTKIKVIRNNTAKDMQYYYLPSSQTLYGYFHETKIRIHSEAKESTLLRMPEGASARFEEDRVLKIDLSQGPYTPATQVSFAEFAQHIHAELGMPEGERAMTLLSAQKPPCADASPKQEIRFPLVATRHTSAVTVGDAEPTALPPCPAHHSQPAALEVLAV